jgi:hypothetical protein
MPDGQRTMKMGAVRPGAEPARRLSPASIGSWIKKTWWNYE